MWKKIEPTIVVLLFDKCKNVIYTLIVGFSFINLSSKDERNYTGTQMPMESKKFQELKNVKSTYVKPINFKFAFGIWYLIQDK